MELDRLFHTVQLRGALFIEHAGDQVVHHVAFARRQRSIALSQSGELLSLLTAGAVPLQRLVDGVEEFLLAERFCEKLDRPGFHRPHRSWNVTVARNEDDRNLAIQMYQLLLEVEPVKAGHTQICD